MLDNTPRQEVENEERRAALRAIGKYATLGAATSIVVLSSADAVKAAPSSNGKACNNPNPPKHCS